MLDHTQKSNDKVPETQVISESQNMSLRGKTPKEVQADLLSGEADDLSVDFTNILNNYSGLK